MHSFINYIYILAQSREKEMDWVARRILAAFLKYVDGFESRSNIYMLYQQKSDLDTALQNRFSKIIRFLNPDLHSRMNYMGGMPNI